MALRTWIDQNCAGEQACVEASWKNVIEEKIKQRAKNRR